MRTVRIIVITIAVLFCASFSDNSVRSVLADIKQQNHDMESVIFNPPWDIIQPTLPPLKKVSPENPEIKRKKKITSTKEEPKTEHFDSQIKKKPSDQSTKPETEKKQPPERPGISIDDKTQQKRGMLLKEDEW